MAAPPPKRARRDVPASPDDGEAGLGGEGDDGDASASVTVAVVAEKGRFAAAAFHHGVNRVTLFSHAAADSDVTWMVQGLQQALPSASRVTYLVL
jgi:hypothetical protein